MAGPVASQPDLGMLDGVLSRGDPPGVVGTRWGWGSTPTPGPSKAWVVAVVRLKVWGNVLFLCEEGQLVLAPLQ